MRKEQVIDLDLGLKNKTAIVLASSDGLGKAIATEFAMEGANVMLFSSSEVKLKAAADEIEILSGRRPLYCVGDLRKPEDLSHLVDETVKPMAPFTRWSTTQADHRPAPLSSLRMMSGRVPLS